jgi:hypothetical protein
MRKNTPLLASSTAAVVGLSIYAFALRWSGVNASVNLQNFVGLIMPLGFVAAVIERAVEIFISPWRDGGASQLEKVVTDKKAENAAAPTAANAQELSKANDALIAYRAATQQIAFAVSFTMGMLASIAGVRALGPFFDLTHVTETQKAFFSSVDVVLSAALLAGGADGIHSLVNAVTTFFDSTAEKANT